MRAIRRRRPRTCRVQLSTVHRSALNVFKLRDDRWCEHVLFIAVTQTAISPIPPGHDLVAGGQQSDVNMMIGVGVNKDSDAVFFMYRGDDQEPVALTIPTSGKPLTRLGNVKVTGINIAEDIGTFKSTKLNLFLTTNSGTVILVTSGLTTIWSQCVLTGLMGAFETGNLELALTLDTWKGTSKMKPCFAAIRSGNLKIV